MKIEKSDQAYFLKREKMLFDNLSLITINDGQRVAFWAII